MALHTLFLVMGGILLIGLLTDELGRRTRLPRVTLLILFGIVIGPSGLDLIPSELQEWREFLAAMALTMVAFLLGGQLSLATLRIHGKVILSASLMVIVATAIIVGSGLIAMGLSVSVALLLAGISTATAPAATQDVVRQAGAKGPFTTILLGIVAVDDAWGIIVFSLLLVTAKSLAGEGGAEVLLQGLWELGGAACIGIALGLPAAFLTGRLQQGEPIQLEALGLVFICAGLAIWLEVSYLLAGIVLGACIVNLAKHHSRPFHEIEHIEWPFMVFFFLLAGASVQLDLIVEIGFIGAGYILLRFSGRMIGGLIGGSLGGAAKLHTRWLGLALMPQAGVALGMAIVAANQFPAQGQTILAVTVGATVIFELFGPVLTMLALRNVGEVAESLPSDE
ncbi:MAG: cation:proton antiporter [Anderseniella sp.]|nr:cation:proton antiporter [Anderseniella sp.]